MPLGFPFGPLDTKCASGYIGVTTMIRIITSMHLVVDDAEEMQRRAALEGDLQRLADGWTPDADTLAACPLIDQWSTLFYPDTTELSMQGLVTGHPELSHGSIITSPIRAMDFREHWIRTHSRFYRLGERKSDE